MKKIFFIAVISFLFTNIYAQEALKSTEEEYYDFLSLHGVVRRPTLNYRTLSDSEWSFTDSGEILDEKGNSLASKEMPEKHVWAQNNIGKKHILFKNNNLKAKIYGPELFYSYNTDMPYGQNDGALWQGRGNNFSFTTGFRVEAYGFELTFKPQLTFSQNLSFDYPTGVYGSKYSYFWNGNMTVNGTVIPGASIDLVQRYGDSPLKKFDYGDSEIRYTWKGLTIGFGTQSPWLGPAWMNPMLGSNNAPTYPKLDVGLRRTRIVIPKINLYLGDFETRLWCGYLSESDYFDKDSDNDHNMVNGLSVSYSPSFIPGLTLGANRIFLTKWKTDNIKYIGRLFTFSRDNNTDGEAEDQKASICADWLFPKVGFEVYGELGLDDFSSEYVTNPFHTAIYTVGLKKTIPIWKSKKFFGEVIFEWSNFEMSQDFQSQWPYLGYYSHSRVVQGYTQDGQIIGAGSGYAGNSQYIGFKLYHPKGSALIYFNRSCPDNNYINSMTIGNSGTAWTDNAWHSSFYAMYKTYMTFGASVEYFVNENVLLAASFCRSEVSYPTYVRYTPSDANYQFTLKCKVNFELFISRKKS